MSLATPAALLEAPELAVLELLDLTLQQAVYMLLAEHPELASCSSLVTARHVIAQTWLADIILDQASHMQHAIARYREATTRASALRPGTGEEFAE